MSDLPLFDGPAAVRAIEARPLGDWLRGRTIAELVSGAAQRYGGQRAHRFLATPEAAPVDQSFAEVAARTERIAAAFAAETPRPIVASLLPGMPLTMPLLLGAMAAGACLPVNPFLEAGAIIHMLSRTGARFLLAEGPSGAQGVWEKLPAIRAALPDLTILICGEPEGMAGRVEDWLAAHADAPAAPLPRPDDIAACFHTGGTTGLPKIARLTHANLAYMAFLTAFGGGIREGSTIPCGMPLFHVGGLIFGGLAPLWAGASVVQLGRMGYRDPAVVAALWQIAAREGAEILFAPPTIAMAALDGFTAPAPPRLRHWVSSAAPLPAAAHRRFTEVTGLPIKEAWGLTEASLVLTFTPPGGESRPGSVGLALPWCRLGVQSLSDPTRAAAPGEPGLVLAQSPGLFAGYLDPPGDGLCEAPHLGPGRWLDTGDVGQIDTDGYLFLTGRAKDLILRGGHNIDPAVIEEAFMALPEVQAAAAVGAPDARLGELPVCYVALVPGARATPEDLATRALPAIAERAARPRTIKVLERLPLTAVGKIDKLALRRDAAIDVLRALYPGHQMRAETRAGGRIAVALSPLPPQAARMLADLGLDLLTETKATE